ncbi:V-type ATP synthase subunit D [Actinoplanes sp. NPDC024001]|uniref:V-type ATP synthase subunit D n=1 Tax=Actinoplanes sp. NPDC024001 TaxID=3154598 RepID=UPI0033CE4C28
MADRRVTGRAGRLLLLRRLSSAQRAVDLLDRKLRILRAEQARIRREADEDIRAWQAATSALDRAVTRAAILGGRRGLRLAAPPGAATVTLSWLEIMGTRFPSSATIDVVRPDPCGPVTAAAAAAAGESLRAAVRVACSAAARRTVETEISRTRRRLHALTERWIPTCEQALQEIAQRLDEEDRDEMVRRRWAAGRPVR